LEDKQVWNWGAEIEEQEEDEAEKENAQIISGNPIQNPRFVDWSDDNPSKWYVFSKRDGNEVTQSNGTARILSRNGKNVGISQQVLNHTSRRWYRITLDVQIATGAIQIHTGEGSDQKVLTTSGTHTFDLQANGSNSIFEIKCDVGRITDASVDNVVALEISDPFPGNLTHNPTMTHWAYDNPSNWHVFGENGTNSVTQSTDGARIISADGANIGIAQTILNHTADQWYEVYLDATITQGTLQVRAGEGGDTKTITSSGRHVFKLQAKGVNDVFEIKRDAGKVTDAVVDTILMRAIAAAPIKLNSHQNLYFDISGGLVKEGRKVLMWECNASDAQYFILPVLESETTGTGKIIVNKDTNFCLGVGTELIVTACNTAPN